MMTLEEQVTALTLVVKQLEERVAWLEATRCKDARRTEVLTTVSRARRARQAIDAWEEKHGTKPKGKKRG